jgi:hypothetical protein
VEATELYPDVKYTSVDNYLNAFVWSVRNAPSHHKTAPPKLNKGHSMLTVGQHFISCISISLLPSKESFHILVCNICFVMYFVWYKVPSCITICLSLFKLHIIL